MNRVIILLMCLFCVPAYAAQPVEVVREGNRLYKSGDYDKAVSEYTAASGDHMQENVARYNLGNALYKRGKAKSQADIDGAITDLQQAIASYTQVLGKKPKDADAQFNKDFVAKALEQLKKKKEEQDKNKQSKDQDKNQDNKDKQDKDKKDSDKDKQQQQQNAQDQKKDNNDNASQDGKDKDDNKDQKDKPQSDKDKKDGDKDKEDKDKGDKGQDNAQQKPGDEQKKDGQGKGAKDMSAQEAKAALDAYQRNEEPQTMLNFIPKQGSEQPVTKDW